MTLRIPTFSTLRAEVLGWLDEADAETTDSTYINAGYALNQALTQRLTEIDWPFMLWPKPITFSLTVGESYYRLHGLYHRPLYFWNRDRKHYLTEVPRANLGPDAIRWNDVTSGKEFVLWGVSPVKAQPTAASVLTIVSTSASDTQATKAVTITGVTADGEQVRETLTPTGITDVTGSVAFETVVSVTKGADWVGTLTLKAGSTTLLALGPTEMARSYPVLRLLWTPQSAEVIEYQFYQQPQLMTADNDVPHQLPDPYKRILVWDALLLMAAYDARLDADRIAVWRDNQQRLEAGLFAAYGLEASSLQAEPRRIRSLEDEEDD